MKNLIIINGPNLNLLGKREPLIYGNQTFEDYFSILKKKYSALNLSYFQSNVEGKLIDKLQEVGFSFDGIILNSRLKLPHSSMHKRNFVLLPLFDIERDWKHPVKKTNIKKLIYSLPNKDIRSINQI